MKYIKKFENINLQNILLPSAIKNINDKDNLIDRYWKIENKSKLYLELAFKKIGYEVTNEQLNVLSKAL